MLSGTEPEIIKESNKRKKVGRHRQNQYLRIKTMFGSFLTPVVCRRTYVLYTLFMVDVV